MTAAEVVRQEVFEDLELKVIEEAGEEWFSAEDIGKALEFAEPRKFVMQIFNRNREEFEGLYRVLNLRTWLKSGGKLPYRLTTFNPQGAYLLAILARTPKSKALRRWLAKFMAHDLDKLRAHVKELEADRHEQQKRIWSLEKKMQSWRKKAQALEGQPTKCLPAPEPHQVAPYELKDEYVVRINARDLKRLVSAACDPEAHPEFEVPWFHRLIDAQNTSPADINKILAGLEALPRILKHAGLID